jgi:hypothetical protein
MIRVTQIGTNKGLSIYPEVFLLLQPRKIRLELPGKKPFRETTLMSIFNPLVILQINEDYSELARELIHVSRGFSQFTHGETGTGFVVSPKYFILAESGFDTGFLKQTDGAQVPELTSAPCLISVMNSGVWVPLKGTYEDLRDQFDYNLREV